MKECPACFGLKYIKWLINGKLRKQFCPVCRGQGYFKLSDNKKVKLISNKIDEKIAQNYGHCLCTMREKCSWCSGTEANIRHEKLNLLEELREFVNSIK